MEPTLGLHCKPRSLARICLCLAGILFLSLGPARGAEPSRVGVSLPNILFCVADDASYPLMGAYGCDWIKTPAFDRIAANGILFTRAYTPNAKCSPSRACILTGRNSWQLEAAANHVPHFPRKFKTYPEALAEQGYHVGFTGKGWAPGEPGVDAQGRPRNLCGPAYQRVKTKPPTSEINACDYAANFEAFLAANSEGKPFCFWYGGHEPHRGYAFQSGIRQGGKRLSDVDRVFGSWPDHEIVRTDLLDYALELEYFDLHLGRMLDLLAQKQLLHNTVVVVTADNGMPFPRVKGQAYEHSNHMPMAVLWPAGLGAPGRRFDGLVSFVDLAPTFLELAGCSSSSVGMQPMAGQSLVEVLTPVGDGLVATRRDHVLIGKERHDVGRPGDVGYPIRGIVQGTHLFLRNFEPARWPAGNPETGYTNTDRSPTKTLILNERRQTGASRYWDLGFGKRPVEELYDVLEDPDCTRNLLAVNQARYSSVADALRATLFRELRAQSDPRIRGQGAIFDAYPYAEEEGRGFYERFIAGRAPVAGWIAPSDVERPETSGEDRKGREGAGGKRPG